MSAQISAQMELSYTATPSPVTPPREKASADQNTFGYQIGGSIAGFALIVVLLFCVKCVTRLIPTSRA